MLELCHNTLFYDTANLIWQLTATRQSSLPSSLPFLLAVAMCVCLLSCPGSGTPSKSPEGWLSGVKWQKNIRFSFFGILSGLWTGSEEGWVNTSFFWARQKREAEDTCGQQHTPGFLFCTHIWSGSSTAHQQCHCWPPGTCLTVFTICRVIWNLKSLLEKNVEEHQIYELSRAGQSQWEFKAMVSYKQSIVLGITLDIVSARYCFLSSLWNNMGYLKWF